MRIFISAGEASGDLYASRVVEALKQRHPDAEFFGCAGPRMQAAGVRTVVDARSLSVVGIVEVIAHIPRIYGEFRKLVRAAKEERPVLAILTDSPDFHLRLAKKLHALGIPVVYLIAPQAWAWRKGRVRTMRRTLKQLLCIFPFEEAFFQQHGVPAKFIGHPLTRIVKPSLSNGEFRQKFGYAPDDRFVVLLPGSRHGEVARHMPYLMEAARRIGQKAKVCFICALPPGFDIHNPSFAEPLRTAHSQNIDVQVIVGMTWDCLAQAEVALAASGTVTVEGALLGAPMVTFYRVNELSWILGRWMVSAPFLSMVNLVAERQIVAELIQKNMTAERMAAETLKLLQDPEAVRRMKTSFLEIREKLTGADPDHDPMEVAAEAIDRILSVSNFTVPRETTEKARVTGRT